MHTEDFRLTQNTQPTQSYPWGAFFKDPDPYIGAFALTDEAAMELANDPDKPPKIISAIIEGRFRGEKRSVVIYNQNPPNLQAKYNWIVSVDELIRSYPRTAGEMIDRALLNCAAMHPKPGESIQLSGAGECLLYADDREGCEWMLRQLESSGYISLNDDGTQDALASFSIESAGWKHIGELKRRPAENAPQAFVAMHFHEDMEPFYKDGIRPAIEADGKTRCVRIDGVHHNNKICDEIIAAIRRSRYVVADFTGNRGGVYYEAGFAHGLGIPVIWTVRDTTKELHFDTRQYNHIVYKDADELKRLLTDRIAATIPHL